MKRISVPKRWLALAAVGAATLAALAVFAALAANRQPPAEPQPAAQTAVQTATQEEAAGSGVPAAPVPDKGEFVPVAESRYLTLKANPATGHFIVTDKRSEDVWKSYPEEAGSRDGQNQGKWLSNLESPVMISYVEFNVRRDLAKESNLKEGKGLVTGFAATGQGFQVRYEFPELGFVIPVEVRLGEDYVETKILKDGLKDARIFTEEERKTKKDNEARLVSVRLYPFLGAHTSEQTDGYLLLPDGPGAIVDFKRDRAGTNHYYNERVYGADWAYSANAKFSIRRSVRAPVFGIKAGEKSLLAVIHEGAEYANVVAAPSGTFSPYNWATAEQQYRFMDYQYTNTKKTEGYVTFTKELTATDRSVRYYLIAGGDDGYVRMAARFRQYLIDEVGMKRLPAGDDKLALQLHVLGADAERGFLWDSYLPLTTTAQAQEIVQELNAVGVERMSVTYLGWQRKGYSSYGGSFPLPGKLGGNEGMRQFADFVHAKGYRLYLDGSNYAFNNTGGDGFRRNRDGLRDNGASVISYRRRGTDKTLVSPRFASKVIEKDLDKMRALHVDGLVFGQGIGSLLNTDYNDKYAATREEAVQIQQRMFGMTKDALGHVQVEDGNIYTWKYVDHIHGLPVDGSGDLFVDRQVPFLQIALHGLVTYSSEYGNDSDDYETAFLKGIEYGAVPSFVVTYAKSQQLLETRSLGQFFSTYYKDWLQEMAAQYQRYDEALGDVQQQWITGHRALADGVFETAYGNGKRIVVNYNERPYAGDGWTVQPRDFVVVK